MMFHFLTEISMDKTSDNLRRFLTWSITNVNGAIAFFVSSFFVRHVDIKPNDTTT